MTEQEKTWLANLKAGDPVIISCVYTADREKRVNRSTPSMVVVESSGMELRYLRRNGRRIGKSAGWLTMPEVTKC